MGPLLLLFKRFEEKLTPKKQIILNPREALETAARGSEPSDREVAQRDSIQERYDILDPQFLAFMALIGGYGARKYGERNWQKSRLHMDKSPVNHIFKHIVSYQNGEPYDHPEIGTDRAIHLAAIAFNAMMEFYHSIRENE